MKPSNRHFSHTPAYRRLEARMMRHARNKPGDVNHALSPAGGGSHLRLSGISVLEALV